MNRRWLNSSTESPPTYASWAMMKRRCYNPDDADFANYGGRGISVSERWRDSYDNFVSDMGRKPSDMTLERVDTNGDYGPNNCIWASRADQANNRRGNVRIVFQGENLTLAQWAKRLGLTSEAIRGRLAQGLPIPQILAPERRIAEVAQHGTVSRYTSAKHNCRCGLCREAWRIYNAEKKKGRG